MFNFYKSFIKIHFSRIVYLTEQKILRNNLNFTKPEFPFSNFVAFFFFKISIILSFFGFVFVDYLYHLRSASTRKLDLACKVFSTGPVLFAYHTT